MTPPLDLPGETRVSRRPGSGVEGCRHPRARTLRWSLAPPLAAPSLCHRPCAPASCLLPCRSTQRGYASSVSQSLGCWRPRLTTARCIYCLAMQLFENGAVAMKTCYRAQCAASSAAAGDRRSVPRVSLRIVLELSEGDSGRDAVTGDGGRHSVCENLESHGIMDRRCPPLLGSRLAGSPSFKSTQHTCTIQSQSQMVGRQSSSSARRSYGIDIVPAA